MGLGDFDTSGLGTSDGCTWQKAFSYSNKNFKYDKANNKLLLSSPKYEDFIDQYHDLQKRKEKIDWKKYWGGTIKIMIVTFSSCRAVIYSTRKLSRMCSQSAYLMMR